MSVFAVLLWIIYTCTSLLSDQISCIADACLDGCQVKRHIKCSISTVSCDVIDLNPSHTELWPGSPTSFTADALPSADQNLAINFTWGLPRDASFQTLKGFILRILDTETANAATCVHFDLSGTNWQSTDLLNQITFYYSCFPDFKYEKDYYIQIQSLPFGYAPSMDHLFVQTPINTADKKYWTTFITVKEHSFENCSCSDIEVSFLLSPFEPELYYVRLANSTNPLRAKEIPHIATHEKGVVTFHNVCEARYKIEVEPSRRTASNDCVCGKAGSFWLNCNLCVVTTTQLLNTTARKPCIKHTVPTVETGRLSPDLTENPPSNEGEVSTAAFILLFVLAAVILSVVFALLISCMRSKQKNSKYNMSPGGSVTDNSAGLHSPLPSEMFADIDNTTLYMQRQQEQNSVTTTIEELENRQSPSDFKAGKVIANGNQFTAVQYAV